MENKTLEHTLQEAPLWLNNFVTVYQKLTKDNLKLLATIYHEKVTFIDPLHTVEGFENLYQYFQNLYQNLSACEFIIEDVIWQDSQASLFWTMTYQHPKLNKGQTVTVVGTSHIKGEDDKVIYHRDYLDLGAMLYEQLPILGKLTKWIKTNAAN
ncbi:nuclear transport factor 2 family protein [Colwellia demingiae]|uniref:Nuclear transport factor 2 family protein n=1 Tax=Colwellia demingiae TaxID=89401 RepID=A0A5C6QLV8_9GAMM|nr:nuclear transport factor 2 family protein [Colwellia demingiae]TWX69620.1 nuclear transport factor 2 family protein [Colwellia demingiae]